LSDQTILRVAWLYYMENLTQAEIGERLGLTRAR
jgi:DNA-binding transcriptional regulator LsrR (DeoR family)